MKTSLIGAEDAMRIESDPTPKRAQGRFKIREWKIGFWNRGHCKNIKSRLRAARNNPHPNGRSPKAPEGAACEESFRQFWNATGYAGGFLLNVDAGQTAAVLQSHILSFKPNETDSAFSSKRWSNEKAYFYKKYFVKSHVFFNAQLLK